MNIASGLEDDPQSPDSLDPGLRAAFAPDPKPASSDSVLEILRARGAIHKCISLRHDPTEEVDRLSPVSMHSGIPGRYQVAGEVARGGVGIVLKGHDVDLGREVALKVLRSEHLGNPSLTRRLVEEAQIGGQLQHPGILPIYELGLDSSRRPFFAMKLVRGRTLADLLKERKSPESDQPRFLGVFEQLCHAMAYAHARGVIHRDLKPANIMVGRFGEVQIVDWGLAKVLPRSTAADDTWDMAPKEVIPTLSAQSEAGSVLGTPAYMPPEQARGEIDRLDERSDVFGLGAILCEILTGHPPYQGERLQILERARQANLDSAKASLEKSGAPGELIQLALKCLAADQAARPRNADEVVRAVSSYRNSIEQRARKAEIEAATAAARANSERRVRRLTVALASLFLIAATCGALFYWQYEKQKWNRVQSELRAQRASLELERERRARIESTLQILVPLSGKSRFMVTEAASVAHQDLDRWLHLTSLLREVVSRTAESATSEDARNQAKQVIAELEASEAKLRQRLEKQSMPP